MTIATEKIFEKFMSIKFPHIKTEELYYKEWRIRFEKGMEWQKSDYSSRAILKSLEPEVYPNDKDDFFIRD